MFVLSCVALFFVGNFTLLDNIAILLFCFSSMAFYFFRTDRIRQPEKYQLELIFSCLLFCCSVRWMMYCPLLSICIANCILYEGEPLASVIQKRRPVIFAVLTVGYCGFLAWHIPDRIRSSGLIRQRGDGDTLSTLLSAFGPAFLYQLASLISYAGVHYDIQPIFPGLPGDTKVERFWILARIFSGYYFCCLFLWNSFLTLVQAYTSPTHFCITS
eukprot:TRINITY_DN4225_c0_g1_i2.p1 TRINITY_DN4225_c0_g1~~TRINITY_DN4225_c0_g1_i2.p1  ORF type:complete len:215 (+),score=29.95 TRINITY_DN4225_c0_g1_i2:564-1208(+)